MKNSGRSSMQEKLSLVARAASEAQGSPALQLTEQNCKGKASPKLSKGKGKAGSSAKVKKVGKQSSKQSPSAGSATTKSKQCLPGSKQEKDYRAACGVPLDLLDKYAQGCSTCRRRAGRTASCWRKRGFAVQ